MADRWVCTNTAGRAEYLKLPVPRFGRAAILPLSGGGLGRLHGLRGSETYVRFLKSSFSEAARPLSASLAGSTSARVGFQTSSSKSTLKVHRPNNAYSLAMKSIRDERSRGRSISAGLT